MRREADGRVSFTLGPRRRGVTHFDQSESPRRPDQVPTELGPIDYPDSYEKSRPEHAAFITETRRYSRDPNAPGDPSRFELYCIECSFRPWLDVGDASRATVTYRHGARARGWRRRRSGDRWVTAPRSRDGEAAYVCPGGVRDEWGNFNGAMSAAGRRHGGADQVRPPAIVGIDAGDDGDGPRRAARRGPRRARRRRGRRDRPLVDARAAGPVADGAAPCRRARSLRLRLRAPRAGLRIRSAVVRVDGRRVRSVRGRRPGARSACACAGSGRS